MRECKNKSLNQSEDHVRKTHSIIMYPSKKNHVCFSCQIRSLLLLLLLSVTVGG